MWKFLKNLFKSQTTRPQTAPIIKEDARMEQAIQKGNSLVNEIKEREVDRKQEFLIWKQNNDLYFQLRSA